MPPINAAYLEHQLKRWMRPDAHHFVSPDWRRFVRPGFEDGHPFALYERKYHEDQLRDDHGRWAEEGGSKPSPNPSARPEIIELSAASRKGDGHHYVPRAVVRNRGVSEEAKEVFEGKKTGPLLDSRSNRWDEDHRIYSKAVDEALVEYLNKSGTRPENMTAEQALEFYGKVLESRDLRVRNYNMGIQMREIARRLLGRGGRE